MRRPVQWLRQWTSSACNSRKLHEEPVDPSPTVTPLALRHLAATPSNFVNSFREPYCFGSVWLVASCLSVTAAPQLQQNLAGDEIPAPHRGQRAAAALATIS